jgi:hypothetical protein
MSLRRDFVKLLDARDEYYDEFKDYVNSIYGPDDPINLGGFIVEGIEQYGGEGMGDTYWVVFSLERDGDKKFFKLDGWYASYNGHEFDNYLDFDEVKQVEKVVKVWE